MKRTPHVMVVDDIDDDFATVIEAAQCYGFALEILRAASGFDCIRQLRASSGDPAAWPLLLLLDLDGRGDDCRDTLVEMKTDAQLHVVPIVILTTSAHPRDIQFCYDHHANAYHIKSVNHVTHLQTLQQILGYWINSALLPMQRSAIK